MNHPTYNRTIQTLVAAFLGLTLPWASVAQTMPATITVNSGTTITFLRPISILEITAYWISNTSNQAVSPRVQAAGNYFLRYPGRFLLRRLPLEQDPDPSTPAVWGAPITPPVYRLRGLETYRGTTSRLWRRLITDGTNAT